MAYGTYQTRNPRVVTNMLRSIPLLRSAVHVSGPSATDRLVGALRNALYAVARAKLGAANRHNVAWRSKSQRDAMVALNQGPGPRCPNLRLVATLEAEFLTLAVPDDRWARRRLRPHASAKLDCVKDARFYLPVQVFLSEFS